MVAKVISTLFSSKKYQIEDTSIGAILRDTEIRAIIIRDADDLAELISEGDPAIERWLDRKNVNVHASIAFGRAELAEAVREYKMRVVVHNQLDNRYLAPHVAFLKDMGYPDDVAIAQARYNYGAAVDRAKHAGATYRQIAKHMNRSAANIQQVHRKFLRVKGIRYWAGDFTSKPYRHPVETYAAGGENFT